MEKKSFTSMLYSRRRRNKDQESSLRYLASERIPCPFFSAQIRTKPLFSIFKMNNKMRSSIHTLTYLFFWCVPEREITRKNLHGPNSEDGATQIRSHAFTFSYHQQITPYKPILIIMEVKNLIWDDEIKNMPANSFRIPTTPKIVQIVGAR